VSGIGGETFLPLPLEIPLRSSLDGLGVLWDVAIDGQGYLLSVLGDQYPFEFRSYTVESIPLQSQRIDNSPEPGEQTLNPWWSRAQHNWFGGAGQEIFDGPESIRYAFKASKGINIWAEGKIGLHKTTAAMEAFASPASWIRVIVDDDYLMWFNLDTVYREADIDTSSLSTVTPSVGDNIKCITSDGQYAYVSVTSQGIHREAISAWASFTKINDLIPSIMDFVKGRLLCGKNNCLHEITDYTSLVDGATPIFTHPTAAWQWTGITETGPAIYCSGYSGKRSAIYAITYDASDLSAGFTLGVPRLVWEAPRGEIIHTVEGYLGKTLMIGTSEGVRRATVADENGNLEVSPLIVETNYSVRCFAFNKDYCWFGWSYFDGSDSGLGRIHLGDVTYASDLMFPTQAHVTSVAIFQGRLVFGTSVGVDTYARVIKEHATNREPTGYFTTGEIRFGTFEKKALRFFDGHLRGSGGTLKMAISTDYGTQQTYLTNQAIGKFSDQIDIEGTRFNLMITLVRDSTDASVTPYLLEWRLRADPLSPGRFRYYVPVMLYDKMRALNGSAVGHLGYAYERLEELTTLYRDGTIFPFQTPAFPLPNGQAELNVKIEGLQFKSFVPPQGASGIGGVCLLILTEQG